MQAKRVGNKKAKIKKKKSKESREEWCDEPGCGGDEAGRNTAQRSSPLTLTQQRDAPSLQTGRANSRPEQQSATHRRRRCPRPPSRRKRK